MGDNYLNIIEVYIFLALNLCRYAQIARNRNVYVTSVRLLVVAHVVVYPIPLVLLIIQLPLGWARLDNKDGETSDIEYSVIYVQLFSILLAFVLPISLNLLVVYASVHHVHLTARLRQGRHHLSARDKYHRSLVVQFLLFYSVWLLLWSPNVIVYQVTNGTSVLVSVNKLLVYIELVLDPMIVTALDVRLYQRWKRIYILLREKCPRGFRFERQRIEPTMINSILRTMSDNRTNQQTLHSVVSFMGCI